MKTPLAQNQFISNSVSHVPVDAGSAAASPCPHSTAAAVAIKNSCGSFGSLPNTPNGVMQSCAASLDMPGPQEATNHIPEIFHYARKLSAEARTFVPDYPGIYQAMLDPNAPRALENDPVWADDPPLFLKREA